jgi:hypothetical protein
MGSDLQFLRSGSALRLEIGNHWLLVWLFFDLAVRARADGCQQRWKEGAGNGRFSRRY